MLAYFSPSVTRIFSSFFILRVGVRALAAGLVLSANASVLADPVSELNDSLAAMKSLEGEFKQVVRDEEGEELENTSGTFALKRPGLFRWHVAEPFEQLIVSDQKSLWIYDPDLEQVKVSPFDERLQKTPALLLSGDPKAIRENFKVEAMAPEGEGKAFKLLPVGDNNVFDSMELVFENNVLARMRLYDSLGEETDIEFLNLKANGELAAQQFNFTPPPGVDVLVDN